MGGLVVDKTYIMNIENEYDVNKIVISCDDCLLRSWTQRNARRNRGELCENCLIQYITILSVLQESNGDSDSDIKIEEAVELCDYCLKNTTNRNCSDCKHRRELIHELREIEQRVKDIGYETVTDDKSCHCDWGRLGHSELNCQFRNTLEKLAKIGKRKNSQLHSL